MKKTAIVLFATLLIIAGCSFFSEVSTPELSVVEKFLGSYVVPVAFAQVEDPVVVNVNYVTVTWNAPTENTDGSVCDDLATYELAVSSADQDLNDGGVAITTVSMPSTQTTYELKNISHLILSGDFKLWARAIDQAGNASTWSTPLFLRHDGVAPKAIVITITITIPE